ncbi:DUF2207 domain-containing protein [Microcella sp.]|uniref:DUF2207 domain-containing protein n=1 Tax=Microcella sp. TaxID=1913979 RepID=UPI002566D727|nr:DUF2207 domain-containing protein [Microcella sp.]MBX9471099.1 DUF2207 domain-containing protein [Microcella sp.]
MRRLPIALVAGAVMIVLAIVAAVVLLPRVLPTTLSSGPAPQLAAAAISNGPLRADVNAFTFDSFHADYVLGRDETGHATLTTTETLVARFPDFDQNRGIRRSLPATYQGHTTNLQVVSVTDENGQPRPFEVSSDTGRVDIVSAVPEGSYTYGVQTYVITYTQRDVVDFFSSTQAQEFYWNTNGTDWAQPFASVSATVTLDDGLASALLPGRVFCYVGYSGSTDQCEISVDGAVVSTEPVALFPYQNVTVALGFADGTFELFDTSLMASPWGWLLLLSAALAVGAALAAIVLRLTVHRDARGRPVIVAEYLPPRGMSLLDASVLTGHRTRAVASQLVDFAVRRVITIIEVPGGWFSLRSTWRLRLESALGVEGEEKSLLSYFFPGLVGGDEHTLKAQNTTLSTKIQKQLSRISTSMVKRGWRRTIPGRHSGWLSLAVVGSTIGAFASVITLTDEGRADGDSIFLVIPLTFLCFFVVAKCLYRHPLTAEGAELADHIKGLNEYIRLAEADRLRVLQSPQGALREPVDVNSPEQRLKLIERLLPWAVMLKQEREWAKELGEFYAEGQSPAWFSSSRAFSVSAFSAGVGSVASTLSSSYSGSSSSGGSSGGGSSGGGGGGGGGGGV